MVEEEDWRKMRERGTIGGAASGDTVVLRYSYEVTAAGYA
jgi:hypothetical protein